jgi:hypothetical protein
MAMFVLRLVLDGNLRRAEAALLHLAANKPAARKAQRIDAGLNGGQIGAPASTSAPSVMSPLIPLAQSR